MLVTIADGSIEINLVKRNLLKTLNFTDDLIGNVKYLK